MLEDPMLRFVALLLVLSSHPVLAESPPPLDIGGWSVVQYNDHFAELDLNAYLWMVDASRRLARADDPQAIAAYLETAHRIVDELRVEAARLPPWKGDASLRDAVVQSADNAAAALSGDLARLAELATKVPVTNADLAEAEAVAIRLEQAIAAEQARITQVQAAFAKRNRMLLAELDLPEPDLGPEFTHPGLPPEGSHLAARTHVSFAMRYHNHLVASQVAATKAANAFIEATNDDPAELEAQRQASLAAAQAALAAAEAVADWQGDRALRDAVVAHNSELADLLANQYAEYTTLRVKPRLKGKEAARLDDLGAEAGGRLEAAGKAVGTAMEAFQQRWGLAAYQQWAAGNAAPAEEPQ